MRILDLDLGNTRLKWRYSDDCSRTEGALVNSDLKLKELLPDAAIDRVRIAAVAGGDVLDQVKRECRQRWHVEPEVAAVQEHCAGVRQGYREPGRLGIDRWLAILAAYSQLQQPCVVVSGGTAVTVDLLNTGGEHLGGYVVPGLEMMRNALFSGTHAVKLGQLSLEGSLAPGRDTQQAVSHGLVLMVKGLVDHAVASVAVEGEPVAVILTGGDGERMLPFFASSGAASTSVRYLPNLVLDGLSLALP